VGEEVVLLVGLVVTSLGERKIRKDDMYA